MDMRQEAARNVEKVARLAPMLRPGKSLRPLGEESPLSPGLLPPLVAPQKHPAPIAKGKRRKDGDAEDAAPL